MKKLSRTPVIENKYNLDMDKIKKLKLVDRTKLCEPLFWRNNVVSAWCISGDTDLRHYNKEYLSEWKDLNLSRFKYDDTSFWIGIYDNDADAYAGKIRFSFEAYGGMCSYTFNKFYNPRTISNDYDLLIQELFLKKINYLIDNNILAIVE